MNNLDSVGSALILSIAPTLTVLVSWYFQRQQLIKIHQVVNSRLEAALKTVEHLKQQLYKLRRQ